MNAFETYKLQNGMEIILVPRRESPATTVMATVKVGSKYESKETSGLSHFLEHMAFKGTKKRPKPIDISMELDGLGAQYNAFTSQEHTAYYAKVRNASFEKALDVVSDIYLNSTIPAEEMEKERGVIIEEINMYEDLPMRKVEELFLKLLYGDQPAGWDVAGRKEVIQRLKREDFIKWREKHYKSGNTIIAIAGGYNTEKAKEKVENVFSALKKEPETALPEVVERQDKPEELIYYKDTDQTHMILGFRAFDIHDKRRWALEVLADILGGSMSSRLFQKLRGKLGISYYVGSDAALLTNSGIISASAGVSKKRADEAVSAILEEFVRLKDEKVGDKELKKAKDHIIGNLFLSLETSNRLAGFYTAQRVAGLPISTPEDTAEQIQKVKAEEIMAVANELFVNKALNLAAVGPFHDKSFSDILKV